MNALRRQTEPDGALEDSASAAVKAQLRLREWVLAGDLPAGGRVTEVMLAQRLGVSRTPVRAALVKLAQEGLLQALPNGGFVVRTFSEQEVADAIELRGTLEGLAVRLAAERGVRAAVLEQARACLDEIDEALRDASLSEAMFSRYVELNARFHRLLTEMPGSEVLRNEIERAAALPFASPSGFVGVRVGDAAARDALVVAQYQHRQVLEAIARREAGRAEALMREHSRLARQNMQQALRAPAGQALPGVQLIRPA